MKIIIGYLYYDLMNLYGDSGNIKVLEYQLNGQKIDVEIKRLSLDDKINFNELDLIYMGSGTKTNKKIVLKDLLNYKVEIKKYYNDNKFFLITGNSLELFGQYIVDTNNNVYEGLNLFKYYTKENEERIIKEIDINCNFLKDNLIGYTNQQGNIYNNNKKIKYGIYKNNFYGIYLTGPVLVRNPEFMEYLLTKLILQKSKKKKLRQFNIRLDEEAYLDYIALKNS